jgi:acyl-CoA thioester hydrolase
MNKNAPHAMDIRIYYEDTDAGGIVYYANYLKFLERARSEWVRSHGLSQQSLLADGIAFVVKKVNLDYHAPAQFEQIITVHTTVCELKRASLVFTQTITDNTRTLVSATVKVACVNLNTMKPCAIPTQLVKELQGNT